MARIDPTKIYDRDPEARVYGELVRLEMPRRVLVVSERSGMGKTDFLRKLKLESTRDHSVPVALVALDNFVGRPDEFAIVEYMYGELKRTGAPLPNFARLRAAHRMKNVLLFAGELLEVQGFVDMSGAVIESGAPRIAGVMININAETYVPPPWDDEMDAQAKIMCVEAFLADLSLFASKDPLALMFDAVDKAEEDLLEWIISELVRGRALQQWQDRKLVIVLAGTAVDALVLGRLPADEQDCVERLAGFATWDAEQLKGFLEANDLGGLTQDELTALSFLLESGNHSLMDVVLDARAWLRKRRQG
jgi:hypothetical protein